MIKSSYGKMWISHVGCNMKNENQETIKAHQLHHKIIVFQLWFRINLASIQVCLKIWDWLKFKWDH
jgi:hypothetical protein